VGNSVHARPVRLVSRGGLGAVSVSRGGDRDGRRAFEWFGKAAEQGDQIAQYNLSFMFDKGLGVAQDSKRAAEWYRKACQSTCNFFSPDLIPEERTPQN
jgi:TPR repeat protein